MANSKPQVPPGGEEIRLDRKLFKCPVCFDIIPKSEMYQCSSGLGAGGPCAKGFDELCPQCTNKPWRDLEKVSRNKEEGGCKYSSINLCKLIGCKLVTASHKQTYRPFPSQHQLVEWRRSSKNWVHSKINLTNVLQELKSYSGECLVYSAALKRRGGSTKFQGMNFLYFDGVKRDLTVMVLDLGRQDHDDQSLRVDVTIELRIAKQNVGWSWTGPAFSNRNRHADEDADALRNHPPFKISMPCLLEILGPDEELLMDIYIKF